MKSRRTVLKELGCYTLGMYGTHSFLTEKWLNQKSKMTQRTIPSSGEMIPVVGLGTWIQFDQDPTAEEGAALLDVLKAVAENGGRVIDSSPMYGRSEATVGTLTQQMQEPDQFFYATKVWTSGKQAGITQMESSMQKMQREVMDLMQIHNLQDWQTHLATLRDWKQSGKIRYIGLTHYTNSAHDQLARIIEKEKDIDFIQTNFSIGNRHAEQRLLGVAADQGVAVIVNRPYMGGSLFRKTRGMDLPEWAKDFDIASWGQFFLKYILSHPSTTCAIPGTSNPKHAVDNMLAGYGRMPDTAGRVKMADFFDGV